MKILGTGLSGLVGSRVLGLLGRKFEFEDLSLETGVDITNSKTVEDRIAKSDAETVLHMAAVTDVDACETQRHENTEARKKRNGRDLCWRVNVGGTRNVVNAARKHGKKLIYISTDFVFGGEAESYSEDDKPNPVNRYGETKYEGEKIVQNSLADWLILRLSFPYRAQFTKSDIVRFFLHKLQAKEEIQAVEDWLITPTFIDDIAGALDIFLQSEHKGIYHVVGSSSHTPYEVAVMIASEFGLDKQLIKTVKRRDLFAARAPRPPRLIMKNDKIERLGIKMSALEGGLVELKKQLTKNSKP